MAKFQDFSLVRWDSDDDKVWDWKEPRFVTQEVDGELVEVQEHLYVRTLFIGEYDSIENYQEVPVPVEE